MWWLKRLILCPKCFFKKANDIKRILKIITEKHQVTYKSKPNRLSSEFAAKAPKAIVEWGDGFNVNKILVSKNIISSKRII